MRDLFVIYFGQTPMIVVGGVSLQEVLVTASVRTFLSNLITQMDLPESQEPISWL